MKKTSKWLVWVKWEEAFEDEHEKDQEYKCTWSAEDQKLLSENPANKAAIEQVSFELLFDQLNPIVKGDRRQSHLAVAQARGRGL